jgi:hypothetical protein
MARAKKQPGTVRGRESRERPETKKEIRLTRGELSMLHVEAVTPTQVWLKATALALLADREIEVKGTDGDVR